MTRDLDRNLNSLNSVNLFEYISLGVLESDGLSLFFLAKKGNKKPKSKQMRLPALAYTNSC